MCCTVSSTEASAGAAFGALAPALARFNARMSPRKLFSRSAALFGALAAASMFAVAGPAAANVPLTQISADPFANSTSQHATEVEPDTFAHGSTLVSAFQV